MIKMLVSGAWQKKISSNMELLDQMNSDITFRLN